MHLLATVYFCSGTNSCQMITVHHWSWNYPGTWTFGCFNQYLTITNRLNSTLKDLEAKHKIKCRWTPLDKDYLQIKETFSLEHQKELEQAMLRASMWWRFLLKLKAKYAGKRDLHAHSILCIMIKVFNCRWTENCQKTFHPDIERNQIDQSTAIGIQVTHLLLKFP